MSDPDVFDVPMELGLEFVTIVGPNFSNAEWKLFDGMVNEIDGVCLRVFLIDLKGAKSGCIVDRVVLEPADLFASFSSKSQKLNVHLDVVSWHLLLITFGVQLSHSCSSGQSVETVTL